MQDLYNFIMQNARLDAWLIVGFLGQALFFGRFILQWYASEKAGKSIIPNAFWYLSLAGSMTLLIYSIHRRDIVFIIGFIINMTIYTRNLMLINKENKDSE